MIYISSATLAKHSWTADMLWFPNLEFKSYFEERKRVWRKHKFFRSLLNSFPIARTIFRIEAGSSWINLNGSLIRKLKYLPWWRIPWKHPGSYWEKTIFMSGQKGWDFWCIRKWASLFDLIPKYNFFFSIRNTTLKSAFKEIDKFYVLNSQESLAIETFLRSAVSTDLSCRHVQPTIHKITKSKIVQLVLAMRATEETVDKFEHVISVFHYFLV